MPELVVFLLFMDAVSPVMLDLALWLLGASLALILAIFGVTHSMVMHRFSSMERRLERLETKTMSLPLQ